MTHGQKHINYSAADFERYHNGSMPEAEMYVLEKAALEDPFLADALEGYAFAETPVDDIQELSKKIPPVEKKKRGLLTAFSSPWLRAAAIFILAGGIGYMTYTSTHDEPVPTTTLAVNENKAVVAPSPNEIPASIVQDSSSLASNQLYKADTERKSPAVASANGTFQSVTTNESSAYQINSGADDKAVTTSDSILVFKEKNEHPATQKTAESWSQTRYFQGRVTDQEGAPVAFANINAKDKLITQTDVNGNFVLPAKDSLMLANISAVGYAAVNQNLNSNNQQNIVLERSDKQMSEVVVTAMGAKRQKKDVGYSATTIKNDSLSVALRGKVAGLDVTPASKPVVTLKDYDRYVDSARRQVPQLKTVAGKVILSFKVNKRGEPVQVKVVQSLTPEQDAEAIRLVQQGPKWLYSKGKRVTKTINF